MLILMALNKALVLIKNQAILKWTAKPQLMISTIRPAKIQMANTLSVPKGVKKPIKVTTAAVAALAA